MGFVVSAPLYGFLFVALLVVYFAGFIAVFRKEGFMVSLFVTFVSITFSWSGAVLGFMGFDSGLLAVAFAYIFYGIGMFASLYALKKQKGKLLVYFVFGGVDV